MSTLRPRAAKRGMEAVVRAVGRFQSGDGPNEQLSVRPRLSDQSQPAATIRGTYTVNEDQNATAALDDRWSKNR